MVSEVRPLGVKCNITCHYCYQNPIRDRARPKSYDLDAVKRSILAKGAPFALFGGEPLLLPKPDLAELFAFGNLHFQQNAIQTNGMLIDEEHVALFREHRVQVGLSLDGPRELNAARWAGSEARTLEATAKVEKAIHLLLANGVTPSIITTLHRHNAVGERLERLLQWFVELDMLGILNARVHVLEIETDAVRSTLALTAPENVAALRALAELERSHLTRLRFDIFGEIEALLTAKDKYVSCTWRACDPYTTEAVQGIEGHGESSNCGRTGKNGVDFLKADTTGFERYLALYYTPQEFGGCAGCRFFLMCKGQCPGTSIDGDWRNRTEQCETWFTLFAEAEARMISLGYTPISTDPNLAALERAMLGQWAAGANPSLDWVLTQTRQQATANIALATV
jgi:uncharacterized protein